MRLAVLLLPLVLAATEPVVELTSIHADLVALETRQALVLHEGLGKRLGELRLLRLELPGALLGTEVQVELLRYGGVWLQGRAWSPQLSDAVHAVQAVDLRLEGGASSSRLTGTCHITFERGPGWTRDPVLGAALQGHPRFVAVLSCDGRVFGDRVEGQYRLGYPPVTDEKEVAPPRPSAAFPKGAPDLRGQLTLQDTPPAARPAPADWAQLDAMGVYPLACELERRAEICWQELRAATLVAQEGDHAAARAACAGFSMERPDFVVKPAATPVAKRPPVRPPRRPAGDPGLDDLDQEIDALTQPAVVLDPAQQREQRAQVAAIAARIAAMRRLAEAKATPAPVQRGSVDCGDPAFGPWYGETHLPTDASGCNLLPAELGTAGPPDWAAVASWRLLGPFPPTPFTTDTPSLPELVTHPLDRYRLEPGRLVEGSSFKGDPVLRWQPLSGQGSQGYLTPPNWSSANRVYRNCPVAIIGRHSGIEHSRCYAEAVVHASQAGPVWAAIGVSQRGKLWLDDRLVWTSPAADPGGGLEELALMRLDLRAGTNRLLLRCDVAFSSPWFWMKICTRGAPRSAAAVAAWHQAMAADRAVLPRPAVRGWRDDGSGISPAATPPMAWNLKTRANVRWRTPLPYWGNGTPVPDGDRLYVTMEPDTLVCLAADDGRELWRRQCSIIDLMPAAERAEAQRLRDAWWAARQARDEVPAAVLRPHKWIDKTRWYWDEAAATPQDERIGASAALLALLDRRDALQADPDPEAVQGELTTVLDQIEQERQAGGGAGVAKAQALETAVKAAEKAWLSCLGRHSRVKGLEGYWYDYDGWAFATPVCDGRHVWWKNGMGVAACFDRDGTQRWLVATDGGGSGSPTIPSPLLHQGRLILYLPHFAKPSDRRAQGQRLLALDAASGVPAWEATGLPSSGWNAATPALLTVTDGAQRLDVLVTAGGAVVRVEDGIILVRDLGVQVSDASPAVAGDVVVFCRPNLVAVQFLLHDRDTVGCRRLWGVRGEAASYGGVIVCDGRVHALRGGNPGKGPGEDGTMLRSYDLLTGALLDTRELFRKGGNGWSLHAASKELVYLTSGDALFRGCGPRPPADAIVLARGARPLVVARNVLDRSYGAPAPDGDRLYVRGYTGVACIAPTGAAGRAYELHEVARTLLDQIPSHVPAASEVLSVAAGGPSLPERVPTCRPLHGQGLGDWLFAEGKDPVAVAAADWRSLGQAALSLPDLPRWTHDPANLSDLHRHRRVHDLGAALHGRGGTVLLATRLASDRRDVDIRGVWRVDYGPLVTAAWIGGTSLQDGARFRLDGPAVLCLRVEVPVSRPHWVGPRLWRSDDPSAETEAFRIALDQARPWLEQAAQELPGTPEGAQAAALLRQ